MVDEQTRPLQQYHSQRRKIRLIQSNAKCRYLKKLPCKGTLYHVGVTIMQGLDQDHLHPLHRASQTDASLSGTNPGPPALHANTCKEPFQRSYYLLFGTLACTTTPCCMYSLYTIPDDSQEKHSEANDSQHQRQNLKI